MRSTPAKTTSDRLREIERSLFFIVGCGRSGTTLLQSILISHPDVAIASETKFASKFPAFTPRLRDLGDPEIFEQALKAAITDQEKKNVPFDEHRLRDLADDAPRTWDGLFLALLAAVADKRGRSRVGEKSPVHTPLVGRLSESFPNAKFIHLVRDPRAVMRSRLNAGFAARSLGTEIPRWSEAVDMHRQHAERLGPSRYLLVKYEDLVTNLEPTVQTICRFLDLEMRPEMLRPHERESKGFDPNSEPWMENTLKPVFTGSVDRWRTELTPTQIALIEFALADDMRVMGYEPIGATTSVPALRLALSRAVGRAEYARRKLIRGVRKLTGQPATASSSDD